MPRPGDRFQRIASRSGSWYGRGRSSRALATLKIAVFAPIARASERIAVAVKPRVDANVRTAYRRSWRREHV